VFRSIGIKLLGCNAVYFGIFIHEKPKTAVMKGKKYALIAVILLMTNFVQAQKPVDYLSSIDSIYTDYDALFNDFQHFIDSLTKPRSFTLFDIGMGNGYLNYESKSSALLEATKKLIYTPSLGYYSKSGLGISGTAIVVHDGVKINPFQYVVTGSYDYLKSTKFSAGVALSHFFTRDSLPFYTSPLKNEAYAYFSYRKLWFKPTLAVSYGWGSRTDYEEREDYITSLQLGKFGYTSYNTRESVNDMNLTLSVRHDFYLLNVLSKNDYVRFTPQFIFTSGTQQFGFNQTSNSYTTIPGAGMNVLYNSDKVYLDNQLNFQPLSLSAFIKTEYSKGKFFVQPKLLLNYYFPATENNFSTTLLLSTGVIF
jgi:hypothetical protein